MNENIEKLSKIKHKYNFDKNTFGANKYKDNKGGDIYIVQTEFYVDSFYKIGITTDIIKRLSSYRCGNLMDPKLHFYYPCKNIKQADILLKNYLNKFNEKREIYKIIDFNVIKEIMFKIQNEMNSEMKEIIPEINNDVIKIDKNIKKENNKNKIKERIINLLKLDKGYLTDFENELITNDKSLEKHFNLRIFLNNNIKEKLGESIEKNLFIESLKNKYSKISICRELMGVLNIDGLEGLNKGVVDRFDGVINNKWLKDNIDNIKGIFDFHTDKYDDFNYYNIYLLLINILKNLFDVNLLTRIQLRKSKNRYIYYTINNNIFNNHNNIINKINLENFLD